MFNQRFRNMLFWRTFWLLSLFIGTGVNFHGTGQAEAVDITLNDTYGNTADKDSNINFATVTDNAQYRSEGDGQLDLGALAPLYGLADSLVDTSLPDFPFKWIKAYKDSDFNISEDWKEIVTDYLGYIIAVVLGILFAIVFPIVGCCCCCCRCCCGKCGGRRVIKEPEDAGYEDKCGRFTAIGIFSVFLIMALTGSALMYVTNDNLSSSLDDFQNTHIDKLDDVNTFFDSTVSQAEQLASGNFNFTLEVLFRDLDNIGYLLGQVIHSRVLKETGLNGTLNDIEALDEDTEDLHSLLETLKSEKANMEDTYEKFHEFTKNISDRVEAIANQSSSFNSNVSSRNFVTNFNASELPREDFKILVLEAFINQSISSLTDEPRRSLNEIPQKVQNETKQKRQDLRNDVEKYTEDVEKAMTDIKSLRDDVLNGIDFDDLKADGKEYADKAKDYDQYRWYGGLGLACAMLLIVLLMAGGLFCGLIGSSASILPTERGALSNAGGNMLVAALVFTFIFCWLTMLMTTLLFMVGAPVNKFVCGPLNDLGVLDTLLNDYELIGETSGNGSWLGEKFFKGKNVDLRISDVLGGCKKGEPVYRALKLEEAGVFNLSEVTDYNKRFNISEQLNQINVDFNGLNLETGSVTNFTGYLKNFDSQMDYDTYNSTLSVAPVKPSRVFVDELKSYLSSTTSIANRTELEQIRVEFMKHINDTGTSLENSINKTLQTLEGIQKITREPADNNLTVRTNTLEQELQAVQSNLSSDTDRAFRDSIASYAARLTKILDTFTNDIENGVKRELGLCTPLWNMYSDLVVFGVCDSIVGALSGWWFAMGWTVFFLISSSCVSLKLTKHFRRMRMADVKDSGSVNDSDEPEKAVHHFKNKVFHADGPEGVEAF